MRKMAGNRIMKRLDSICFKLSQNASINHSEAIDQATNSGDDKEAINNRFDAKHDSASPSIRPNKRKNFTPKLCRLYDDESPDQRDEESFAIDPNSSRRSYEEGPKRRRYSFPDQEQQQGCNECDDSVSTIEQTESRDRNKNDLNIREKEEWGETSGLLSIVKAENHESGALSDRSSGNRSISIFPTALTPSASVSPASLIDTVTNAFVNAGHSVSPSILHHISPSSNATTNTYIQQPAGESESIKSPAHIQIGNDQHSPPFVSYIVRFAGNEDCGAEQCRFFTSREHFHCKLCNNKLFTKKEEMLRHYKWHRKREESLAYGFMRYSASDDCAQNFFNCVHNLRQTHYHCLQDGCDKVYISTSDVQMHANSHRKQAHIAKEGFQRVKGSEHCVYAGCPFADPSNRTTHFHCLRPGCTHSFKNKADMDKHKAHHTRDEQLTRDGFKKYMKSESCPFPGCAFSRIVNHIHCIRPGCDYVLHSTSQMYSHKRKHEKQDKRDCGGQRDAVAAHEAIARAVKNAASSATTTSPFSTSASPSPSTIMIQSPTSNAFSGSLDFAKTIPNGENTIATTSCSQLDSSLLPMATKAQRCSSSKQYNPCTFRESTNDPGENHPHNAAQSVTARAETETFDSDDAPTIGIDMNTLQSPIQFLKSVTKAEHDDEMDSLAVSYSSQEGNADGITGHNQFQHQSANARSKGDDSWKKFITRYTANDPCIPLCPLLYKDHYHCTAGEGCKMTFKSKDGVRDHAKQHEQLCLAIEHFRSFESDEDCSIHDCPYVRQQVHYHCAWNNCSEAIGSSEPVFRRLEHHKVHEYSNQLMSDSRTLNLFASGSSAVTTTALSVAGSGTVLSPGHVAQSQSNSICVEGVKRKRGRPPKCNVLDVNVVPSMRIGQSQEFLLTSFKLPKTTGGLVNATSSHLPTPKQPHPEGRVSPPGQNKRGRPRTVSSPRHTSLCNDDGAAPSGRPTPVAAALLQQQQAAHQLQRQWEMLRMWSGNLDSLSSPASDSPLPPETRSTPSTDTKLPQFDGFTTYMVTETCPDSLCRHRCHLHYHCRLPRCFYSSDSADQLEAHRRDFHEAFEIPEGYACYDRSYNCRHVSCQYNGQARHFHCQKAGCSAALLKFNQLTEHTARGHHDQFGPSAQVFQDSIVLEGPDPSASPVARDQKSAQNNIVRTSGIFYPASAGNNDASVPTAPPPQPSSSSFLTPSTFAALAQSLSPAITIFKAAAAMGVPPTAFMPNMEANFSNGMGGAPPNNPFYIVEQQCGRPFCKLKRRLHYHCALCQQGFSHFDRLAVHMQKHGVALPPVLMHQSPMPSNAVSKLVSNAQRSADGQDRSMTVSASSSPKVSGTKSEKMDCLANEAATSSSAIKTSVSAKSLKFHVFQPTTMKFSETSSGHQATTSGKDANKKEPILSTGYAIESTGKINLDSHSKNSGKTYVVENSTAAAPPAACRPSTSMLKFVDCTLDVGNAIRKHAPNRDCVPQSFSAATNSRRKIQQQGSASIVPSFSPACIERNVKGPIACTDDSCPKNAKSHLHYHCEKCEFWTPESTKWHMHVKQHARMDQVAALGFRKVLGSGGHDANLGNGDRTKALIGCPLSSDCTMTSQSHYHCVMCNFTAFNQSQMSLHRTTKHSELDKDTV